MSYTIQYTEKKNDFGGKKRKPSKRKELPAFLLLILVIIARLCWPQIGTYAEKLFLYGVSDRNEAAVTAFFQDVRSGDDLSDALTAFCREVLTNAETVE